MLHHGDRNNSRYLLWKLIAQIKYFTESELLQFIQLYTCNYHFSIKEGAIYIYIYMYIYKVL